METLKLDRAALAAGLRALGAGSFFVSGDPAAFAPATWAMICATKGLDDASAHVISEDDLESAFHALGPWVKSRRCHCGWRTQEVWGRLRDIAAGKKTLTMAREMGADVAAWESSTAPWGGAAQRRTKASKPGSARDA